MDALEFMKKMNQKDIENRIIEFFDENMAMFNLLGHYEDINMSAIYDKINIKYCFLKNQNAIQIDKLVEALKGMPICLYGKKFNIILDNQKKCLYINLELVNL